MNKIRQIAKAEKINATVLLDPALKQCGIFSRLENIIVLREPNLAWALHEFAHYLSPTSGHSVEFFEILDILEYKYLLAK